MILWASISAFGVLVSVYMFVTGNNNDGVYFGIVAIAGVVMFYVNRRRYKTHLGSGQNTPQQKN